MEVLHRCSQLLKHPANGLSIATPKSVDIAVRMVDFCQNIYAAVTQLGKLTRERLSIGSEVSDILFKLRKPENAVTQFRLA